MSVGVYLNFKGNAKEALAFYEQALNGKNKEVTTFGDMPADENYPIEDALKPLIMNASLEVDGSVVMLSDVPEGMGEPFAVGNNVTAVIDTDTVEKAKQFFANLAADGKVVMEMQETFWSPAYGCLVDKFDISWQINCTPKQ